MIDFNRPAFTGKEFEYIRDAVERSYPKQYKTQM